MRRFDYDRNDIHACYDTARELSSGVLGEWMECVSRGISGGTVGTIVDLGCGTGRFSGTLADFFSATVRGVDPSEKMLGVARDRRTSPSVEFLSGSAESIPLDDGWADLVFMSMVYHHLRDPDRACVEIARVLKPGGHFCVRTSTCERLHTYPWFSCFPEALEIDLKRLPSAEGLREELESRGFRRTGHEIVHQFIAGNIGEYYEKIGMRAVSSLREISDEAFEKGMERFARYCADCDPGEPVYEDIELFTFCSTIER